MQENNFPTPTQLQAARTGLKAVGAQHGFDAGSVLQAAIAVQRECNCVPRALQLEIAQTFNAAIAQVAAVVDFYVFLSESPRGLYDIRFSDSITDHMLGSRALIEQLCARLGVTIGVPRADGLVTIDVTACTGLCDQGPALLINGSAIGKLDTTRIDAIATLIEQRTPLSQWPAAWFQIDENIQRADLLLATTLKAGDALRATLNDNSEKILAQLEQSGLNGRGGAGFNTASKWRLCRDAVGAQHYVVCNADEGEPGTFKDRVLLMREADAVIEGMTLCARAIGAQRGFIYLRGEYQFLLPSLRQCLARRRSNNLLGTTILGVAGFDFDIDIHLGAGAYICGEESALLESLEGNRGIPRIRPPFPVTHGYRGQPTVVSNVETFFAAAKIIANGAAWFNTVGGGHGTKVHSISGDCARPGVYEFPVGTSIAAMLSACGANDTLAVQVAGAAGELLTATEFERKIDLATLKSGGSFIVFGADRSPLAIANNFTRFFADESCGFCTPCRVGTQQLAHIFERIAAGRGTAHERVQIERIIALTGRLSHCGLGLTAVNPARDLLQKFPEHFLRALAGNTSAPKFDLDAELSEAHALQQELLQQEALP